MEQYSDKWVYGSPCRPLSKMWCKLPGELVQLDNQETGYYTYLISDTRISRDDLRDNELVLVSRPK